MVTLNLYLSFNGNCREVFNFYKSVFGGEFQYIGTYGEMPIQDDLNFDKNEQDKIMHIALPISKETILMGNDHLKAFGPPVNIGDNFAISIKTDTKQNADELFIKLSEGGLITMPLKETFWGSYYGNLTDKFGIKWKMSVDLNQLQ
jgi:PhnB protein